MACTACRYNPATITDPSANAGCETCSVHGFHLGQAVVVHRSGGDIDREGWYVARLPFGTQYAYTAPECLLVEVWGLRGDPDDPWSWIAKRVYLNDLRDWQRAGEWMPSRHDAINQRDST